MAPLARKLASRGPGPIRLARVFGRTASLRSGSVRDGGKRSCSSPSEAAAQEAPHALAVCTLRRIFRSPSVISHLQHHGRPLWSSWPTPVSWQPLPPPARRPAEFAPRQAAVEVLITLSISPHIIRGEGWYRVCPPPTARPFRAGRSPRSCSRPRRGRHWAPAPPPGAERSPCTSTRAVRKSTQPWGGPAAAAWGLRAPTLAPSRQAGSVAEPFPLRTAISVASSCMQRVRRLAARRGRPGHCSGRSPHVDTQEPLAGTGTHGAAHPPEAPTNGPPAVILTWHFSDLCAENNLAKSYL